MDVSKLPKLSQTPKPPDQSPAPPQSVPDYRVEPVRVGGEAWISILIGGIVLFMQTRFHSWLGGRGAPWIDAQGQPIAYTQTLYFIHDLGLVAFGAALVLDGILMLICRPWAVIIGMIVTLVAAMLNLLTCVRTMSMGPQWMPIVALILSLYTAMYQWKLLRALTAHQAAPMT